MSEEDHKKFNLIYESLLLEGKGGNLTDLTLGMVLAEKPLTWLQVMHERLKHLTINSKRFKDQKKAKYNAQARAKEIKENARKAQGRKKENEGKEGIWKEEG